MQHKRFSTLPLLLLVAWMGTAAAIASSSCSGDPSTGSTGGGGTCSIGCGHPDAGGNDADAMLTDSGDEGADAPNEASDAPDDTPAETGTDAAPDGDVAPDADADAADGSVGIPCAPQEPQCPGALTCCGAACVDIHEDPLNCGGCAVACAGSQFCTGVTCSGVLLKNVCDNPSATVAFDVYSIDNVSGTQVGDAIALHCAPAVTVKHLDQSSPLLLDQTTNQPILGPGETLVAGGGSFGQRGLAYLDEKGYSPLYVTLGVNGELLLVRRSDGATLVNAPAAVLTDHHDYFVYYVAVEPGSGTLVLAAFGLLGPGTTAAAWHWKTVVAPGISAYDKGWYVYEWTDVNADGAPDGADTFGPVAEGG